MLTKFTLASSVTGPLKIGPAVLWNNQEKDSEAERCFFKIAQLVVSLELLVGFVGECRTATVHETDAHRRGQISALVRGFRTEI